MFIGVTIAGIILAALKKIVIREQSAQINEEESMGKELALENQQNAAICSTIAMEMQ